MCCKVALSLPRPRSRACGSGQGCCQSTGSKRQEGSAILAAELLATACSVDLSDAMYKLHAGRRSHVHGPIRAPSASEPIVVYVRLCISLCVGCWIQAEVVEVLKRREGRENPKNLKPKKPNSRHSPRLGWPPVPALAYTLPRLPTQSRHTLYTRSQGTTTPTVRRHTYLPAWCITDCWRAAAAPNTPELGAHPHHLRQHAVVVAAPAR